MNPDTNELRYIENEMERVLAESEGFEALPRYLQRAAKTKLNGKKSVFVSRASGGKLSRWSAKRRRERRDEQKIMVKNCQDFYRNLTIKPI